MLSVLIISAPQCMFSRAFRQRAVGTDFSPLKGRQGFNNREFPSLFALLAGSISCLAARFTGSISDEVH